MKNGLRKTGIRKRVLSSSAANYFAKILRLFHGETPSEVDSQVCPKTLTENYILYDEQKRVKLQMLELDRKENEAFNIARHNALI